MVTRDETNDERELPDVAQELEDGPAAELPGIPLNVPSVEGRELDYVQEVVRGGHLSSGGAFARRTAELLAADSGAAEVLMTTSCTAALELTSMLMDLQEGDTVVVPSSRRSPSPAPAWPTHGRAPACSSATSSRTPWAWTPPTSPRSSTSTCGRW